MNTTIHTDTTRAISSIAPATRSARSRAFLFLVAAACALVPAAANAAISWVGSTPPTPIDGETTVTVSGSSNPYSTNITGAGTGVLTVQGTTTADTLALSGTLGGFAGNINVANSTLKLSADNHDYAGAITVTGGVLSVTVGDNLGSGAYTLNNSTLEFNISTDLTFNTGWALIGTGTINITGGNATQHGALTGADSNLIKTGAGYLHLDVKNTYTGSTTISAGRVYLHHSEAISASSGVLLQNSADLTLITSAQIQLLSGTSGSAVVDLRGNTLTVSGSESSAFAGRIYNTSGSGKLIKSGAGKLTLSNPNNDYSNGTEILGGTISIGADANLGGDKSKEKNKLSGGTLELTAAGPFTRLWEITANSGISVTGEVIATQSAALSGDGGLTKSGTGTLILSAANSYKGGTTISGGTVSIADNNRLGENDAPDYNTLNGGILDLNISTNVTFDRGWTLIGTGTINISSSSGNASQDGVLKGANGNLLKTGAGFLHLDAKNLYTGSTTVSAGRLYLHHSEAIAASSGLWLQGSAEMILPDTHSLIQLLSSESSSSKVDLRAYTLTVSGSESSTFDGIIYNSVNNGGFTKSGSSTLTLTNADNAYIGETTVNGTGSLVLSGAGTIATSSGVTLGGSATFSIADITAGNATATIKNLNGTDGTFVALGEKTLAINGTSVSGDFAGKITGGTDAKLTKAGNSTLTLSGTNTYGGGTAISGGTVSINSDAALGSDITAAKNTLGGATLVLADATTYERSWTLDGTGTISTNGTATQNGILIGGNFTKGGSGTLTLSGVNTYTGATSVGTGTLALSGSGSIATSTGLTLTDSATFSIADISAENATASLKNLNGTDGTFVALGSKTLDVSGTGTFEGILSGEGGKLIKSGSGTLTLSNADNSYDGGTTISGGTLSIGANAHLGTNDNTADNVLNGGILQIVIPASNVTFDRGWTLIGTGTINIPTEASNVLQDGVLTGKGDLLKTGIGFLHLDAKNLYEGSTTVSAGRLYLHHSEAIAASSGLWLQGSAEMILADSNSLIQLLSSEDKTTKVDLRSHELTISGSTNSTFAGVIEDTTANGKLIKSGSGTLTLSGTNTYIGTEIFAGTLSITSDGNLGGAITDETKNKLSGGTLALAAGSYARAWTLTEGTNSTINNIGAVEQKGLLAGTGSLTKTGAGKLTISHENSYGGGTTISGGTVSITANNRLGSNDDPKDNVLSGGILEFNITSNVDFDRGWTLTGTGTMHIPTAAGNALQKGFLQGKGDLLKTGEGYLHLEVKNTYEGSTTVSAGRLYLNNSEAITASSGVWLQNSAELIIITSTQIQLLSSISDTATVDLRANTLTVSGSESSTFAGLIYNYSGSGKLIKAGAGKLTLTHPNNTYTGGTTISGGTLSIGADGNLGTAAVDGTDKLSGGTLELTGAGPYARAWTLVNGTDSTIRNAGNVTQSGALNGTGGSFTKDGEGILTLTAASTYTGTTTVAAGTLLLSGLGTISSGGLTVANGATFDLSGIDGTGASVTNLSGSGTAAIVLGDKTLTVSGAIDFTGKITSSDTAGKLVTSGSGERDMTLTGDSVLAAIDVTGSKLSVNGNLTGVAGGAVTIDVNEDGVLGGTGSIKGVIVVHDGGTLSPGNSPGQLNVNGDVTLQEGATLRVEINGIGSEQYDNVTLTPDGVFTFDALSIVTVDVKGLWEDFSLEIITSQKAVKFTGTGGIVDITDIPVTQLANWELTLSLDNGGKSVILTGVHVPEPGTYALFGAIGAVALALIRRRKNKK